MENVILIRDLFGGCFPGFRVGGGFRAVACLYFFPQGKGILLFKQGLYFCLCFPLSKLIAYIERRMSRGDKR